MTFPIMLSALLLASNPATNQPVQKIDTIIKTVHDTVYIDRSREWTEVFGFRYHSPDRDSIWHKPVQFYISKPNCSALATDFYYGDWRPSCNQMTTELLSLATTDDKDLRPFYRWCLTMTIRLSDGCLAEEIGVPARRYAEKYPKEFFEYMDADTTGKKYEQWTDAIFYSGFYDLEEYKTDVSKKLTASMLSNCKDCDEKLKKRIEKFAKDCFQNLNLINK
ncbi:MAG: hypothetical protein JWO06_2816 [Bacteroidota bacterium]|nr:hypothetical protein [Bacteroidota bacterium]